MLAILEAKKLIEGARFPEIDKVFSGTIPANFKITNDKTICLITDVRTDTAIQGNNDFYGLTRQVEVQIFYKITNTVDFESFETRLMKLFKQNHWSIVDIREHTLDPDTSQVTAVFYVAHEKVI